MEILKSLLPFVILIIIMYFLVFRPQQQETKKRKEMIDSLKKGDKIITAGGLIVDVYKVEEKYLSVKINEDTIVKLTKEAVARKYENEI
ncbi:preprotein translocase subunit YajC [Sulfurimonas sp.]|uniref:preprotein translocase subunit YajC n=1 Tax=Sulfurimonas sp. TaxID=2022749 RepID=UPI0025F737F3|nr:preprotein translocase subunit YajC [Sulfurimonas sp.]MDD5158130.1 preprotein translocase subunit YajC [Sulfurimonas sp.]